jgi:hypothetical protein
VSDDESNAEFEDLDLNAEESDAVKGGAYAGMPTKGRPVDATPGVKTMKGTSVTPPPAPMPPGPVSNVPAVADVPKKGGGLPPIRP